MAAALTEAFAIDTGLQRKHGLLAGVGGFLIRMLFRLQRSWTPATSGSRRVGADRIRR
jgi:hypothetical protein